MRWTLVIHGGAGSLDVAYMTPARDQEVRAALRQALAAGTLILGRGGSALDAVESAVRTMEDDPHFNAGRGSVFTADGTNELDAAIMDGATRSAGAVAGVMSTKNPIRIARAVMNHTSHVMLIGPAADHFALEQGIEQVNPSYFRTAERWQQLQEWRNRNPEETRNLNELDHGTVGAVARDVAGHVAAATSTGGTTGSRSGRVGDAPIIGAGTYLCCVGQSSFVIKKGNADGAADFLG